MTLHLGIDIGVQGAIAIVDQSGAFLGIHDMPVLQDGPKGRRAINAPLLAAVIFKMHADHAFVEGVGARPGEAPWGRSFSAGPTGGRHRRISCRRWPSLLVSDASLLEADRWPNARLEGRLARRGNSPLARNCLPRVRDDGRAEAALIAAAGLYGKAQTHDRSRSHSLQAVPPSGRLGLNSHRLFDGSPCSCGSGEPRPTQEREQHILRVQNAHGQVHAGDIEHHKRHCLRRSRETFQDQAGRHFLQISETAGRTNSACCGQWRMAVPPLSNRKPLIYLCNVWVTLARPGKSNCNPAGLCSIRRRQRYASGLLSFLIPRCPNAEEPWLRHEPPQDPAQRAKLQ